MSGCLEGYKVIAEHILSDISEDAVRKELSEMLDGGTKPSQDTHPLVLFSSTNPGPIITMRDGKFSNAAAIAISKGKIVAVGSLEEAKAAAGSTALQRDLGSDCVVPGFVEPHLHIILSGMLNKFLENFDPLYISKQEQGGPTFEDALNYIAQIANDLKEGAWLIGYGFDPSRYTPVNGKFTELTWDTFERKGLDKRNPIFITNASGHLGYANQKAFEVAKISSNPDYYPMDSDGHFTGVCLEPDSYQPFLKSAIPGKIFNIKSIWTGMKEVVTGWSQLGFTTVFDAGIGMNAKFMDVLLLDRLNKTMPLRITGAAANMTPGAAKWVVPELKMPEGGATSLKIKTIKMWMDGSTQGFTAALNKQYDSGALPVYFKKSPFGWARWDVPGSDHFKDTQGPIVEEMTKWAKAGYQLMIHVNGDCASDVVLDAFEVIRCDKLLPQSGIHRLEHFTVTSPAQVERCKELNLGVSHTIGHVKYWGNAFQKYIFNGEGDPRAARIDPVKDDLDNGVVYSFNSDSPVSRADALSYVSTAAGRWLYDTADESIGRQLGQDQCVSVEAALAGVTINPARQILLDDEIGSLVVGKDANFVILTRDISAEGVKAEDISNKLISETWFEGVNVYTAPSE